MDVYSLHVDDHDQARCTLCGHYVMWINASTTWADVANGLDNHAAWQGFRCDPPLARIIVEAANVSARLDADDYRPQITDAGRQAIQ